MPGAAGARQQLSSQSGHNPGRRCFGALPALAGSAAHLHSSFIVTPRRPCAPSRRRATFTGGFTPTVVGLGEGAVLELTLSTGDGSVFTQAQASAGWLDGCNLFGGGLPPSRQQTLGLANRCHPHGTRPPASSQVTVDLAAGLTAQLDDGSSEGCALQAQTLTCTWTDVALRTVKLVGVSATAPGPYACALAASWTLSGTPGQATLTETLTVQACLRGGGRFRGCGAKRMRASGSALGARAAGVAPGLPRWAALLLACAAPLTPLLACRMLAAGAGGHQEGLRARGGPFLPDHLHQ